MPPIFLPLEQALPSHHDLFYNGAWRKPLASTYNDTLNPSTGKPITRVAQASATDVDAAVEAAHEAFLSWRKTTIAERQACLHRAGAILREHAVTEMLVDANRAANSLDYFAGLIPMLRGETLPGPFPADAYLHYTVREPIGVVARFMASNHPFMFAGSRMASVIAAGNTVVVKPPDQAPLSGLRLAELLDGVFPPGVLNILPGGPECGQALATHPLVKKVTLIGSVATGKVIQREAADTLKPTLLELGGKNALIAFPDANLDQLVQGVIFGPVMSVFRWTDESEMLRIVNSTSYGLTGSIFTRDLATAQRMISQVEAGFVWVNEVGKHFLNVPFGGVKESGNGRDECLDELLAFTAVKSVNIKLQ
ncbi:hypothetical protein N7537_010687 [Penicillium hordei]|uniref:aldehyde dehydrogenase (NAD(+)) n=1 Tax=Penicillium hordei TaxID=40994 RepID=A0AAD6DVF3_9EURO|nr:uncharacterized protein N7537_010687 [Penicillium hordei]KAJ5593783.1 hypothetical protein N7537_010687 [Penicillium hordei]